MRRRSRRCSEKTSNAQLAEACCDLGSPREGVPGTDSPYERGQVGEQVTTLWQIIVDIAHRYAIDDFPLMDANLHLEQRYIHHWMIPRIASGQIVAIIG